MCRYWLPRFLFDRSQEVNCKEIAESANKVDKSIVFDPETRIVTDSHLPQIPATDSLREKRQSLKPTFRSSQMQPGGLIKIGTQNIPG